MPYKVVLTFELLHGILNSIESYGVAVSCGAVFVCVCVVHWSVLTFKFVEKSENVTIHMKAIDQYLAVVLFNMLYKVVLTFESVDEILKCVHSNES